MASFKIKDRRIVHPKEEGEVVELDIICESSMGEYMTLMVKVPSEWRGWETSTYHVKYCGALPKDLGAHFQEVYEWFELEGSN